MFTGLVEETGTIISIISSSNHLELSVNCTFAKELTEGESVAVNGVCLTARNINDSSFTADVTPETYRRTSLEKLSYGSKVNLERAMKADSRFGGHIVSGHVDTTGIFLSAQTEENAVNIRISIPVKEGKYLIEKGSVCLDGISLTVTNVEKENDIVVFGVAVIPHTWKNTTLCQKNSGDKLNIECDIVGKYIEHFLNWKENPEQDQAIENLMSGFTSFH